MSDLSVDSSGATAWKAWGLRPVVVFATTYTAVTILHELAHSLTAYFLGVPSTLFHFADNIDRTQGNLQQRAIIALAGPLFALCIGLVSWAAYLRTRNTRLGLPLLYIVMFGIGTFFGNLISTAFVGDFSRVASVLQWPMALRYTASILGVVLLCGLSFLIGMELRRWTPVEVGALQATVGMVVLPAIFGTALAVLISLPMPAAFIFGRLAESSFWIAAAVGTLVSRKQPYTSKRMLALGWLDLSSLLAAVLIVRLIARGITFAP